jgi:cellulose synthase operon protein YhjQ
MTNRLITICSPKGGVGRTTLAANVAGALARTGDHVLAIDLDVQNALRLSFGLPVGERRGWGRGMLDGQAARDAAVQLGNNLLVLPFGTIDATGHRALAAHLEQNPDWLAHTVAPFLTHDFTVVVDTPAGPSPFLDQALRISGLTVTLLQADAASLALLPSIEQGAFAPGAGGEAPALVLNMIDPRRRLIQETSAALQRRLGDRLISRLGYDDNFGDALAHQALVIDHAPTSKAAFEIRALADALTARLNPLGMELRHAS